MTGHYVLLAENYIFFSSKLWKPKLCVRSEQTLNAAGLALTINKQASLHSGIGNAQEKNAISSDRYYLPDTRYQYCPLYTSVAKRNKIVYCVCSCSKIH